MLKLSPEEIRDKASKVPFEGFYLSSQDPPVIGISAHFMQALEKWAEYQNRREQAIADAASKHTAREIVKWLEDVECQHWAAMRLREWLKKEGIEV